VYIIISLPLRLSILQQSLELVLDGHLHLVQGLLLFGLDDLRGHSLDGLVLLSGLGVLLGRLRTELVRNHQVQRALGSLHSLHRILGSEQYRLSPGGGGLRFRRGE